MSKKTVKLPWQAEMMHRLYAMDSSDHLRPLYFILLRDVGKVMTAAEIAIAVGCAIDECAGSMPRNTQDHLYHTLAPRIIEALVRDEAVAEEAKRELEKTLVQQVA